MIAGQAAELLFSGAQTDDSVLSSRELKTTALMRLMMVAGGIVSAAPAADIAALAKFGECLGRAYQIYDDLADMAGDRQSTGKSVGQDSRHLRPTIVNGLDSEQGRTLAADIVEAGKEALFRFGNRREAELLRSAADYIVGSVTPAAVSSESAVQEVR
jgi:geranylgeranyl pyrophosphate synthase